MLTEDLAAWYADCVVAYLGRPRPRWTHAKKLRAVELMLRKNPHRSDRSLCADTSFSRELIASVRSRLVSGGEIPSGYRVGVDGKHYNERVKT